MKVAVFGATGFIGTVLMTKLAEAGHEATPLDIRRDAQWRASLKGQDAVVNLAGTPLFAKRWTMEIKSAIHDSRVDGTRQIVDALGKLKKESPDLCPKTLVNGSAIGYYGPEFDREFDESAEAGADFLAFVCREWEEQAAKAQVQHGIRSVYLRTGIVLGKNGGALEQLIPPFKAFAGGPTGSGKQWMSWVHIEDVVGIILHSLENDTISGPINATAPNPLRNKDFSKALGKALNRPAILPMPSFMLYLIVGEAAEVIANGQKVLPKKALESGYTFKYPKIEAALKSIV